jgi:hypothetical protein
MATRKKAHPKKAHPKSEPKNKSWVEKALVRADHIARGLCRDCTAPAKPGTHSCVRHLAFAVIRKRRWRIYHGLQKPISMHQKIPNVERVPIWTADVPFEPSYNKIQRVNA